MTFGLFDNFFNRFWENKTVFNVNIYDCLDSYIIEAYLGGISKNNICVTYEGNELTISLTQQDINLENTIKKEFESYVDKRSFIIPNATLKKAKSTYENGKLTIKLPKEANQISQNNSIIIE
jgi:HSP20 family molecular chaperone IbpA